MATPLTISIGVWYPQLTGSILPAHIETTDDISVTIYPQWGGQIALEWSVPSDWSVESFNVYSSDSDSLNFIKLNNSPVLNSFYFLDRTDQNTNSKFNEQFYRVEAIFNDGSRITSQVTTWENKRNDFNRIRAREIARREDLLLRKFVGVKSFIFRRRRYGVRCPTCWDSVVEKIKNDHCETCFGTGYKSGFEYPIEVLVQYDPTPAAVTFDYLGKMEQNELTCWTTNVPAIFPLDLIYRFPDSKIYRVQAMASTELSAVPVRQIMRIVELAKQDIEYKLVTKYPGLLTISIGN